MIAEPIPQAYDAVGRRVVRPFDRRKGPQPTFPLGRYVSQPLSVECHSLTDIRRFLSKCKYVSDKKLFGKDDYWQPPEEFEKRRQGDCEDFAFWVWRQLMNMGFTARIVFGRHGRYGAGHAWVEFCQDDRWFLLEPLAWIMGERLPRLSTLRYHPRYSVAWDGEKLSYFAHQNPPYSPSLSALAQLLPEYLWIRSGLWTSVIVRIPRFLWRLLKRVVKSSDRGLERSSK
ncbi:MAG TPA: transglutaminase domain-containing protein [Terriglobales bacterium]|nr:transglutaminase domain-containing protein [Terriglobales bacterium]